MDVRDGTLTITDGTTRITFLDEASGIQVLDWKPRANDYKQGGVWQNSPIAEGRKLAFTVYDSVAETLSLSLAGLSQSSVSLRLRELRQMLKNAADYWTEPHNTTPVWIEFRPRDETDALYAVLLDGNALEGGEPFSALWTRNHGAAVIPDFKLNWVRDTWRDNPPGEMDCVQVGNEVDESHIVFDAQALLQTLAATTDGPYPIAARGFKTSTGTLLVSGYKGIYRDATGVGDTFANVAGADDVSYGNFVECDDNSILLGASEVNTTNPRYAYVYRSIDDGATWAVVFTEECDPNSQIWPILVKNALGEILVAFSYIITDTAPLRLHISDDNGVTWDILRQFPGLCVRNWGGLQGMCTASGTLVFVCQSVLLIGGICTIVSYDNGASWTIYSQAYDRVKSLKYASALIELGDQWIIVHVRGVWRSSTAGASWIYTVGSWDAGAANATGAFTIGEHAYLIDDKAQVWHSTTGRNWDLLCDLDAYEGYALIAMNELSLIGVTRVLGSSPDDLKSYQIDLSDNAYTSGRAVTCAEEVYLTNHHLPWNITHIKTYDSSAGAYTDIHPAGAFPLTLLPNPLGANDAIMFACAGETDGTPFSSLVFDLAQGLRATGGVAVQWQYNTGAGGWSNLVTIDHTSGLRLAGVNSIHWQHPSNWASETYNGVKAYWIRLVVTAVAGVVTLPQQQNRDIYTIATPYLDIDGDQLNGDLSVLAQMLMRNVSSPGGPGGPGADNPLLYDNRMVLGARSIERGENFTPYLNATDRFEHDGIVAYVGEETTWGGSPVYTTGRRAAYAPTATSDFLPRVAWQLTPAMSVQYYGEYHAWAICAQGGGDPGDFIMRLRVTTGSGGVDYLSLENSNAATGLFWQAVDLGQVSIPASGFFDEDDQADLTELALEVACTDYTGTFYIYGIVLMPVDEWAGDFIDLVNDAESTISNLRVLDIDSATYPKRQIRAIVRTPSDQVTAVYEMIKNGPASLEPAKDQRLWTFSLKRHSSTGTHTGAHNQPMLTDASGNFTYEGVEVGWTVYNVTDGSSGTITARTATTVTATLAGGIDNDWDTGDYYYITPSEIWTANCEISHTGRINNVARYFSMRGDT